MEWSHSRFSFTNSKVNNNNNNNNDDEDDDDDNECFISTAKKMDQLSIKKTAGINLCAVIKYFKIRTIERLKSHFSSFEFYWKDCLA